MKTCQGTFRACGVTVSCVLCQSGKSPAYTVRASLYELWRRPRRNLSQRVLASGEQFPQAGQWSKSIFELYFSVLLLMACHKGKKLSQGMTVA
jgi:hypothetical protein